MRGVVLGLLVVGLLAAPAAAGTLQTRDLLVSGPVPDALLEEAGRLASAVVGFVEGRTGVRLDTARRPLRLHLVPDVEALRAALPEVARRGALEGAGGWTEGGGGPSWVALQHEAFDTRRLILHELTHQALARVHPMSDRMPAWYREGLAEHVGWHRRGEQGVEVGVLDVVAFNRQPERARARALDEARDPWAVAVGEVEADWVDGVVLVEALLDLEDADLRERFRTWERGAWRTGDDGTRFGEAFADRRDDLVTAVRAHWSDFRRPWRATARGWDEQDGAIVGTATGPDGSRPTHLMATAFPPGIEARIRRAGASDEAGLLVQLAGARLRLRAEAGAVVLTLLADGAEQTLGRLAAEGGGGPDLDEASGPPIAALRWLAEGRVQVGWGEATGIFALPRGSDPRPPEAVGLWVGRGAATFEAVRLLEAGAR